MVINGYLWLLMADVVSNQIRRCLESVGSTISFNSSTSVPLRRLDLRNTTACLGGWQKLVTFKDLAGAIRATGGLVIPPEFDYTGSSPMLVRSYMVSELEKTDAAQRSCELFRGSLISHLIGEKKSKFGGGALPLCLPKKQVPSKAKRRSPKLELTCTPEALIDVAAAIGLRWQQEVVQAEVPSPRHAQRRTQHPGFVDELRMRREWQLERLRECKSQPSPV